MRFFIDTANVDEIRQVAAMGILNGVTTSPGLFAKAGRDIQSVLQEILDIVDGPISVEVVSLDAQGMVEEALPLADIHQNIVVKVPLTTEGLKAVYQLARRGIRTNVTLVFSANQALMAARAGASFVSAFIGRLDDISIDGEAFISDLAHMFDLHALDAEIVASSIRHPMHVTQAARAGAHIATVPFTVFDQMVKHPLTDRGIERVLADWSTLQKK